MVENKEVVRLRTKKLANGNESLYLDIYIDGKRKYEFLKLYLIPGKENKARNKETLRIASAVKAQRLVEIQNGRFGFEKKADTKIMLAEFLDEYVEEKKQKRTARYAKDIDTVVKHVKNYIGSRGIYVSDVDKVWCMGFINYLSKVRTKEGLKLEKSSIFNYYSIMVVALNKAVRMEYIERNPFDLVAAEDKPKRAESRREYLTLEEVKILADTDIKNHAVKNAFLFSCFTGLRYSDIVNLTWDNVRELEDGVVQLEFVQQKTKHRVVVPINSNALQWLPQRRSGKSVVFELPEPCTTGNTIRRWVAKTSITKKVTFHVARHTYATMLLYYGADVYTVSKLLGHTNVQTTQIYAKVMDESKRRAVNLIPEI